MKLNLTIDKIDDKITKVDVTIPQKEIDTLEKNIIKELSKTKEIDGFKQGDAPEYVIRFTFADEITEEKNKIIFENISEELLEKYKLDIAQMEFIPEYDKVDETSDTFKLEFAITKSIFPTVELADYKRILPKFVIPTIARKEVANELTRAIKSVLVAEPLKEERKKLEKWDIAVLDIKTTINDETTESKDVMIEVGSGSSIPGFEDALVGMEPGYSKDIKLTFPKDFSNPTLANQDVEYTVILNEIKMIQMPRKIGKTILKKIMPNDTDPTMELLEQRISDSLFFNKLESSILKEKILFMDDLIEQSSYKIDDDFLTSEVQNTLNTLSDEEKIKLEDDDEALEQYKENIQTNIINWYKYKLVLQELLQAEEVTLSNDELDKAFDDYIIKNNFEDPEKAREELEKDNSFFASLRDATIEDKLFYKLFNLSK